MFLKRSAFIVALSLLSFGAQATMMDNPPPALIGEPAPKSKAAAAAEANFDATPEQVKQTGNNLREHARAIYMMESKIPSRELKAPYSQMITDCASLIRALGTHVITYENIEKLDKKLGELTADGTMNKKKFDDWNKARAPILGHPW